MPTARFLKSRNIVSLVGLGGAALVVAISVVWGQRIQEVNRDLKLGAAPLVGSWTWRISARMIPAIAVALLIVWVARRRFPFWGAVLAHSVLGMSFCFALAATDGLDRLLDPVVHRTEYWFNLRRLPNTAEMLREYSKRSFLLRMSVHLKGHPPGFPLLLKWLEAVRLGRPWVTGALSFLGVGLTIASVAGVVRRMVSERAATALLPFLAVAPFMVWMGVSADAFFCGVGAAASYLLVRALTIRPSASTTRPGLIASGLALLSGLLFGFLLMLTYGATTFGVIPFMLLLAARGTPIKTRLLVTVVTAVGVVIVFGVFAAAGFWWFDGLNTTRRFYWTGTAQFRPWNYFLIGNIGALLIAVGPVVVVGISRLRQRSVWPLVGAGIVAACVANASQYSKGEVERIWVLFMPWLTIGVLGLGGVLTNKPNSTGGSELPSNEPLEAQADSPVHSVFVALTAAFAITLQVALQSKW